MPFQAGKKEGEPNWASCCVIMRLRWGGRLSGCSAAWHLAGGMGNGCVFLTDPSGKIQPSDVCLDMVGVGHPSGQGQLGRRLHRPDSGKMSPLCREQLRIKDHR